MSQSSKQTEPSLPTTVDITSNKDSGKTVSLLGGFAELRYYESILQDSIKASYIFIDSGNAIEGQSTVEGLPVVGTEDVRLVFEDNNENKLDVELNVNKVTPVFEDTDKSGVHLQLVSEEFLRNEDGDMRIIEKYSGKISDHVEKILQSGEKVSFKTEKPVDIEETSNDYNFLGNNRKPYFIINYLSKYAVPISQSSPAATENNPSSGGSDKTAGFLFFETSEGYHFKSIDALFKQEQKKSYIYNESTGPVPAGYDGKILKKVQNNAVNAQEKMMMGAYGTKLVMFNPFNCHYEVVEQTATEGDNGEAPGLELAGEELPVFNKKFQNKLTRTTYHLLDIGSLPAGATKEQIESNEQENLNVAKNLNQAIRRYNQVFSGMMEITIAGDFSLHAGDVIFVDIPAIQTETDDTVDRQSGGLYIIADLCHLVNPDGTWTKLNLARDSFGRKGNHSTR